MLLNDPAYIAVLIESLDDSKFAALCNSLLSEIAGQHGLRTCLALNLRVNDPDGGIDARCVNSPKTMGRLLPRPFVDYQFRSGSKKKSPAKIIEEDVIAKPRVLEGLRSLIPGLKKPKYLSAVIIQSAKWFCAVFVI